MARSDLQPLREIWHGVRVRYLTVRPRGFELEPGAPLRPAVEARILRTGSARTLYRERKPRCRSLDGVRSITAHDRHCASCKLRARCTPQVRLDLVVDRKAFRLLLAYTSAKGFLVYQAKLLQRGVALEDVLHRMVV
jgi:hypothetical protein